MDKALFSIAFGIGICMLLTIQPMAFVSAINQTFTPKLDAQLLLIGANYTPQQIQIGKQSTFSYYFGAINFNTSSPLLIRQKTQVSNISLLLEIKSLSLWNASDRLEIKRLNNTDFNTTYPDNIASNNFSYRITFNEHYTNLTGITTTGVTRFQLGDIARQDFINQSNATGYFSLGFSSDVGDNRHFLNFSGRGGTYSPKLIVEYNECIPPANGDGNWVINITCQITSSQDVYGNITLLDRGILNMSEGSLVETYIDFLGAYPHYIFAYKGSQIILNANLTNGLEIGFNKP